MTHFCHCMYLFSVFVFQSHTYVNLTDLSPSVESVLHSEVPSVTDVSRSPSTADGLCGPMASLSESPVFVDEVI